MPGETGRADFYRYYPRALIFSVPSGGREQKGPLTVWQALSSCSAVTKGTLHQAADLSKGRACQLWAFVFSLSQSFSNFIYSLGDLVKASSNSRSPGYQILKHSITCVAFHWRFVGEVVFTGRHHILKPTAFSHLSSLTFSLPCVMEKSLPASGAGRFHLHSGPLKWW